MVTALVLQLIQCSVKIPEKVDEVQDAAGTEDGEDGSKPQVSLSSRTFMVFVVESSPPNFGMVNDKQLPQHKLVFHGVFVMLVL